MENAQIVSNVDILYDDNRKNVFNEFKKSELLYII